jgi:hypothetical protein
MMIPGQTPKFSLNEYGHAGKSKQKILRVEEQTKFGTTKHGFTVNSSIINTFISFTLLYFKTVAISTEPKELLKRNRICKTKRTDIV